MPRQSRTVDILLVEDNRADVDLIIESFADAGTSCTMHSVNDGEKALQFLYRQGDYADAVRPDLVLLDLNLPRLDGREVLQQVKTDAELKTIPVIVLTSSEAERDVLASYRLHANCYIVKPVGLEQFYQVARAIERFWFDSVVLPPGIPGGLAPSDRDPLARISHR